MLLNFKDLDELASASSVKSLIEKELYYCTKSKLPEASKKIKKCVANYNPQESIVLGICLHIPLKRMDLTKKEAGRSYREDNVKLVEAMSIMVNVESPKFRNWWRLKCAAVNESKGKKKNGKNNHHNSTMILKGISDNAETDTVITGMTGSTTGRFWKNVDF